MTMLDRMRRHKGWLKWSLVIVVVAFVAFYIPDLVGTPGHRFLWRHAGAHASICSRSGGFLRSLVEDLEAGP